MSRVLAKLTKETSRLEWLRLRQKGIGGSDASAVLGMNRWKSPVAIWMSKTVEVEEEAELSDAAYWGTVLEDVVAVEFQKRTGLSVRRKNAILMHDEHDFILANIDREIVGQKVGLECKTASAYKKDEWADNEIPAEYIIQCQHYMAVTGYEAWWIACLVGGNQFVYKLIERDEEFIELLVKAEVDFWNSYVVPNVMPPVDGTDAAVTALDTLYPEAEKGTEIYLSADENSLLSERKNLQDMKAQCDDRIQEIDNQIKATMGENETAVGINFAVKWSNSSRTTIDSKRLKAEMPEIYEQYAKTTTSRTFRVREID